MGMPQDDNFPPKVTDVTDTFKPAPPAITQPEPAPAPEPVAQPQPS